MAKKCQRIKQKKKCIGGFQEGTCSAKMFYHVFQHRYIASYTCSIIGPCFGGHNVALYCSTLAYTYNSALHTCKRVHVAILKKETKLRTEKNYIARLVTYSSICIGLKPWRNPCLPYDLKGASSVGTALIRDTRTLLHVHQIDRHLTQGGRVYLDSVD